MTLRQARILSSETDNTIKQEQNTNVNIKITPKQQQPQQSFRPGSKAPNPIVDWPQGEQPRPQTVPLYPNVQPLNPNVNFTQQPNQLGTPLAGQGLHSQMTPESSVYPSVTPTSSNYQERGITDLGVELDSLEKKNSFLEMLVEMYETNPLKINSYVVCKSSLLINMIKLLTECEKVDLVIDDSDVGCGCSASSAKILKIDKILVTKDDKTEELKYCYNNIYTEFIKYGISLKLTV